jgi:hypothetical protein
MKLQLVSVQSKFRINKTSPKEMEVPRLSGNEISSFYSCILIINRVEN